jgi:DNA-binding transcriptional LysR family regulator
MHLAGGQNQRAIRLKWDRLFFDGMRKVRAVPRASTLRLRVGYAPSPTVDILPRALRVFQRTVPWAKVELLDQSTEESMAGISAGKIDVALAVRPPLKHGSGLLFEKIVELPIGIIVPHAHPFARRARRLAGTSPA